MVLFYRMKVACASKKIDSTDSIGLGQRGCDADQQMIHLLDLGVAQHFAWLDQCSLILATQYRKHIFTKAVVGNRTSFFNGVEIWAFAKNSLKG